MIKILVLNGPNLNLLGTRQPDVYGHATLADIERMSVAAGQELGAVVTCVQSNHEGALVEQIHHAKDAGIDGIVLNAGAYTHTSIALRDAISSTQMPVLELHLSNIHAREPFRHNSHIAPVAIGQICGLGAAGYPLAVTALISHLDLGGNA